MEENHQSMEGQSVQHNNSLCVQCQYNTFEPGHAINLCSECRQKLIKYPVPKSILFFAIGILIVIVVSLVRTQRYVSAAIHLGKAENAIVEKRFSTAQRELIDVLNQFPDDFNANSYMMIASAYNLDVESYGLAYDRISTKKTEDNELLERVNSASKYLGQNFPQDTSLYKRIISYSKDEGKLLAMIDSTRELPLQIHIANLLYDFKNYKAVEQICNTVLMADGNFYQAISLMSAVKRNTGKYTEALTYCDRLLKINKEDVYAISQKARIELKRKNDRQAEIFVKEAMAISPENNSALEAKAMLEYFTGKKNESLATLAQIEKQETVLRDSSVSKRLSPIINGLEKYR